MAKIPGWLRRILGAVRIVAIERATEEAVKGAAKSGIDLSPEPTKFCTHCGYECRATANFCGGCGGKL